MQAARSIEHRGESEWPCKAKLKLLLQSFIYVCGKERMMDFELTVTSDSKKRGSLSVFDSSFHLSSGVNDSRNVKPLYLDCSCDILNIANRIVKHTDKIKKLTNAACATSGSVYLKNTV